MNATTHIKKESKLKMLLKDILAKYLPRKTKRLIYVASLLGLIYHSQKPDDSLGEKLEKLFKLGKKKESYVFPMMITSHIWTSLSPNESIEVNGKDMLIENLQSMSLDTDERRIIAKYFEKHVPNWLRYGQEELLQHDAELLLSTFNKFSFQ